MTISAANCLSNDAEGVSVVHCCSEVETVHFRNYLKTLTSNNLEGGLQITSCDLFSVLNHTDWLVTFLSFLS